MSAVKPKRQLHSKAGAGHRPRRSSQPTIDHLLPPDLESPPPVADWLAFLAQLLAAEAMREFAEGGGAQ